MAKSLGKRVLELLTATDPGLVKLDEARADQLLGLANNALLNFADSTEVILDPTTAHPKLIIASAGDRVTYTNVRKDVPEHEGCFDTTLNVLSVQSWNSGHHYWEVDVGEKIYWELGLTYPSIPRKAQKEDCWLSCHSWCLEYFYGDYTAWHGGTPHPLSVLADFRRIGILCSFPRGLVTFAVVDNTTPLYSFRAGTFTDPLHLALCPGHDLQGTNSKPF
ncbi:LOW QUALITY PROTEIN: E3 ubiquitin-protein ligase TRIM21 [Triplophysa dalaica]|uniref:LOW QUALITY PROTEIN: E3 ubiquitin-protein ligase TRIM21 n=1 Tax=Triplophysa dalaica TaxID=1582913 RepID=UPI0024DF7B6A|nr:LOW QUALITY PROTEIN: E3 ubiquitin-protein ligase TRIM21 [Triplophysa dalaica]